MYQIAYRSVAYHSWRFTQPRSVQPAASVRSIQGGMPHARACARLRTPTPTRLRA